MWVSSWDVRCAVCQVLVPLMLAVFFAKLVGDAIGLSVYDTHIKIKGAPVLVRSRLASRSIISQCCVATRKSSPCQHSVAGAVTA